MTRKEQCRLNHDVILSMRLDNKTCSEISQAIGVHEKAVQEYMKENNFPKLSRSGDKRYARKGEIVVKTYDEPFNPNPVLTKKWNSELRL